MCAYPAVLALLPLVELPPFDASNATQTFLSSNDGLLASMTSELRRTMNAPRFDTVVLQAADLPAAPWEAGYTVEVLGTSVVRDPPTGNVRMYYSLRWAALDDHGVPVSHTSPTSNMFLFAMAESSDGVHFTKPALEGKPFVSNLSHVNVNRSNILCQQRCIDAVWMCESGFL